MTGMAPTDASLLLGMGQQGQGLEPVTHLIAAFGVLVVVAAAFGAVARKLGQPAVVGEIIGGIVLGAVVLGQLPADTSAAILPPSVRGTLAALAQIGLVLYMFTVGYKIDVQELRRRPRPVAAVALGATVLPLAGGVALGLGLAGERDAGPAFVLLVGVLLTVTAVPVLARTLEDRGLAGTALGRTALTAAMSIDVVAWVLLSVAVSLAGATTAGDVALSVAAAPLVIGLAATVGRRGMAALLCRAPSGSPGAAAIVTAVLMACAFATSLCGLHLVFGGLVCGLMMPRGARGAPDQRLLAPMEHVSSFLLPVFFVSAGLSVQLEWANTRMWVLVAVVTTVATVTKLLGGWAGARVAGMSKRDAWSAGAMMNSRGLTELVAIEIGRQAGLLDGTLYGVFILMALLTTTMTGPLIRPRPLGPLGATPSPDVHRTGRSVILMVSAAGATRSGDDDH